MEETTSCTVPDHFTGLYEKSSVGLQAEEKENLMLLLVKYRDSFSKDEWDLGLAVHPINTSSAETIK